MRALYASGCSAVLQSDYTHVNYRRANRSEHLPNVNYAFVCGHLKQQEMSFLGDEYDIVYFAKSDKLNSRGHSVVETEKCSKFLLLSLELMEREILEDLEWC